MKTAIIGAGVIGLCTAHYLNKAGHEITVFEREESPGMVTSLGNGGCFSYTMPTVWNAPGSLKMFLSSLLSPETAPIRFKLSALPGMVPWGAKFLKYANETDFVRLTQKNQRLAAYSKNSLESLLDETSIDCAYVDRGFLEIFEDEAALKTHGQMARQLAPDPDTVKILDASETIAYEPSLKSIEHKLAGALLLAADKSGDSHQFCIGLAAYLAEQGVRFSYGTKVENLAASEGNPTVKTKSGTKAFDRLVIAAGNGSPALAKMLGIRLPMKPAKGFSFTIPMDDFPVKPNCPIVDIGTKSGFNPFGDKKLRWVGGAEFSGLDFSTPTEFWDRAYRCFDEVFPGVNVRPHIENQTPWVGFRPMNVDGVPLIGPTKIPGVFLNTGHGWMGWTLAAGSARLLSHQILGTKPDTNLQLLADDYLLSRFR